MADIKKIEKLYNQLKKELDKDEESNTLLFIAGSKMGDERIVFGNIQGYRNQILEDTNYVLNKTNGSLEAYFKSVSDLIKIREVSKKEVIAIDHKGTKNEGYYRVRVDYKDRIAVNRHVKLDGYNFENFYNNDDNIPEEITIQIDPDCLITE